MRRALFLRHGESEHNAHLGAEALDDAHGDRLTTRGRAQAEAAAAALGAEGATKLLTSPMRRARETAEIVGAEIGLEPTVVPYSHELAPGESFEQAIGRVHQLQAALEAEPEGELPLLIGHGILIRFFLLDSLLGERFVAEMANEIWHLQSHNCGLSTFSYGEAEDLTRTTVPGWSCVTWMARPWERP